MSKKSCLRIINDLLDLQENPIKDIYININKDDIFNQYAMIVGPKDTPYFGGFYFFEIKFPKNYPNDPPKIKFLTIDSKVRFHPNLYQEGKVCLSILGTWSGPPWTKIMTLKTVLLSIQSLLDDFPLKNEPGFEKTKRDDIRNIEYNCYIIYHNYRLAIHDVLKNKFKVSKNFEKEIRESFEENKNILLNNLKSYELIYGKKTIKREVYFLSSKNEINFLTLTKKFSKIINKKRKKELL